MKHQRRRVRNDKSKPGQRDPDQSLPRPDHERSRCAGITPTPTPVRKNGETAVAGREKRTSPMKKMEFLIGGHVARFERMLSDIRADLALIKGSLAELKAVVKDED